MSRAILAAALIAILLVGCGGDAETTSPSAATATPAGADNAASAAQAEQICAEMVAESRRMGARFRRLGEVNVNALTLTTRELVAPALPILERNAGRLRALQPGAGVEFGSYVALFDPILSVVRKRVEAGEAGDSTRAHRLELVLIDLSNLQRSLAREAGLETCDVDFIRTFSTTPGSS